MGYSNYKNLKTNPQKVEFRGVRLAFVSYFEARRAFRLACTIIFKRIDAGKALKTILHHFLVNSACFLMHHLQAGKG